MILVMLLGLYPIVELTRVIWTNGIVKFPELETLFVAETVIMWFFYLGIMPVLWWALSRMGESDENKKIN